MDMENGNFEQNGTFENAYPASNAVGFGSKSNIYSFSNTSETGKSAWWRANRITDRNIAAIRVYNRWAQAVGLLADRIEGTYIQVTNTEYSEVKKFGTIADPQRVRGDYD